MFRFKLLFEFYYDCSFKKRPGLKGYSIRKKSVPYTGITHHRVIMYDTEGMTRRWNGDGLSRGEEVTATHRWSGLITAVLLCNPLTRDPKCQCFASYQRTQWPIANIEARFPVHRCVTAASSPQLGSTQNHWWHTLVACDTDRSLIAFSQSKWALNTESSMFTVHYGSHKVQGATY